MRAALELQFHTDRVSMFLWQPCRGGGVAIGQPTVIEMKEYPPGEATPRDNPTMSLEMHDLIELHDTMTKELTRLGYLKPPPVYDRMELLERELAHQKQQVRDLRAIIGMSLRDILRNVGHAVTHELDTTERHDGSNAKDPRQGRADGHHASCRYDRDERAWYCHVTGCRVRAFADSDSYTGAARSGEAAGQGDKAAGGGA